ncbi:hypothetical protein ABKN59_002217 [Abortiporus biennis]
MPMGLSEEPPRTYIRENRHRVVKFGDDSSQILLRKTLSDDVLVKLGFQLPCGLSYFSEQTWSSATTTEFLRKGSR